MFYVWKVFDRRKSKIKCLAVITFVFFVAGFLLLDCFCSEKKCSWSSEKPEARVETQYKSLSHLSAVNNFSDLDKHYDFNQDTDVFIFLHIQKTGGTNFGLSLVKNTSIKEPCVCFENRKRCDCRTSKNYLWIISRHSNGWVCGLHADWTELHDCVPGYLNRVDGIERMRRYFYFTVLRDPLQRYLSEWKHVQRGSTWVTAKLKCGGRRATRSEVPLCFKGKNWMNVTLDEFAGCKSNLAQNRQTRMMADLRLVGCYDKSVIPSDAVRSRIMLQSAKDNLRSMAFFGLTEYQAETSFLFEHTFGIKFTSNFTQINDTRASKAEVSVADRDRVLELNSLDAELYSYARDLFLARVHYARMKSSPDHPRASSSGPDASGLWRSSRSRSGMSARGSEPSRRAARGASGRGNVTRFEAAGGYEYNNDDDNDNPPYMGQEAESEAEAEVDAEAVGRPFRFRGGWEVGADRRLAVPDGVRGQGHSRMDAGDRMRSESSTTL